MAQRDAQFRRQDDCSGLQTPRWILPVADPVHAALGRGQTVAWWQGRRGAGSGQGRPRPSAAPAQSSPSAPATAATCPPPCPRSTPSKLRFGPSVTGRFTSWTSAQNCNLDQMPDRADPRLTHTAPKAVCVSLDPKLPAPLCTAKHRTFTELLPPSFIRSRARGRKVVSASFANAPLHQLDSAAPRTKPSRGRFVVSFTGSPLVPSLPALPAEPVRQLRLRSRLQPLRGAPRSHPPFPPRMQGDSCGSARGAVFGAVLDQERLFPTAACIAHKRMKKAEMAGAGANVTAYAWRA